MLVTDILMEVPNKISGQHSTYWELRTRREGILYQMFVCVKYNYSKHLSLTVYQFTKVNISALIIGIRACHKSKISLHFFGTRIFSLVCIYINVKFWFWQNFSFLDG